MHETLARLSRDSSVYSLIHADMHPGNILVDGDRLTVIDFDDTGFGWHQYDIATALTGWQTKPNAAEIERAYIDGHQARFLFAADRLGLAVASGGVTLMAHDTLQRIGNWRGFNRWIADDYSVTRSDANWGVAASSRQRWSTSTAW